ncbi:MAG: hypothetical protein GY875_24810 [Gammaproteobacteria bacterium]|nr:hypothetical protein [Gammaproteobacteria bacterium]
MKHIQYFLFAIAISSSAIGSSDMFPEWKALGESKRGWYTQHLKAAKKQPVSISSKQTVYRFTWLRSFHNPIVIRIECAINCTLEAKRLSGAGGYEPGEIAEKVNRQLSNEEKQAFTKLFLTTNFWAGQPQTDIMGTDGAQWILEATRDDRYQAWDVWSPNYDSQFAAFQELCGFMIGLSGIEIPSNELY